MHNQSNIPLRLVMRTILIAIVALHVLNLFAQSAALSAEPSDAAVAFAELFTVNAEGKIPTWYSAATLLLCAGLLIVIGLHRNTKKHRARWLTLAAMFAFVSMDEASALHDELSGYLYEYLPTDGFLRSVWVIPAGIGVALLGLWILPLLRALPRVTRNTFVLAAVVYLGGAMGMEMAGAALLSANGLNMNTSTYALLATIEELLEMAGVAVFIVALLHYMNAADITFNSATLAWKRIAALTACAVAFLCVAGLAGQISRFELGHGRLLGFVRLFHLDGEGNATAWFSSMAMLTAAMACAGCALAERFPRSPRSWWILAVTFTVLSVDEFASLHELSIEPLRELWQTTGVLHYPWVLGGALVVMIVTGMCAADLRRLPRRTAQLILLSGAIFVSGAIGVEIVGAWWASTYGLENLTYQCIVAGEETLEMIGIGLFLCVLLRRLSNHPVVLAVDDSPRPAAVEQTPLTSDMSRAA